MRGQVETPASKRRAARSLSRHARSRNRGVEQNHEFAHAPYRQRAHRQALRDSQGGAGAARRVPSLPQRARSARHAARARILVDVRVLHRLPGHAEGNRVPADEVRGADRAVSDHRRVPERWPAQLADAGHAAGRDRGEAPSRDPGAGSLRNRSGSAGCGRSAATSSFT